MIKIYIYTIWLQIKEIHRREDFALNNADNILESSRFMLDV